MAFVTKKTNDAVNKLHNTLLCAHAGWGKTTQCRFYQEHYGPGLILSAEGGLASVADVGIDYLPFTSWDGDDHDPDQGIYSFKGIVSMLLSDDFRKQGYNWLAVDSITELSSLCETHYTKLHEGNKNGFALWMDYSRALLGSLKWLRDFPLHTYVTCLLGEETDANGAVQYWPLVKGSKVSKEIPGIFDHVLCGGRRYEGDPLNPTVTRFIVTDEVGGYHGKVRDPHNTLNPIEECDNVPLLLSRIHKEQ